MNSTLNQAPEDYSPWVWAALFLACWPGMLVWVCWLIQMAVWIKDYASL